MYKYHPQTPQEMKDILDPIYPERTKCIYCGDEVYYESTKITIHESKKLQHKVETICGPTTTKTISDKQYSLCVCQKCLEKNIGRPKNYSHIFNSCNPYTIYAFNIPQEEAIIYGKSHAVTKENMIRDYGEEEGMLRWEAYKKKQAETNTFEYKKNKYGWTEEQFKEYNKSRAVTRENLIKRHGEEKGLEIWDNYVERQRETKSFDYMCEKFGKAKAIEINSQKILDLKNFIRKYGEEEGVIRYNKYITSKYDFYSNISQEFFAEIDDIFTSRGYHTYYATKNDEYKIPYEKSYVCLDYYIKELKVCIEFNGSVFHADPRIYKEDDTPNPFNKSLTSKIIWEADKNRYEYLENNYGIKTIVVWEKDYREGIDIDKFISENLKQLKGNSYI